MNTTVHQRSEMVNRQLKRRGIQDAAVLAAMGSVPREAFLSAGWQGLAYEDSPLPIEEGQTISQPYMVAKMCEALEVRPQDCVLDVGTGSGYAAAILSQLAGHVYTIEIHSQLSEKAKERFRSLGYQNITCKQGDGSLGWPEHAPYDAIMVAACSKEIPEALLRQLKKGGRLIFPLGEPQGIQQLVKVTKESMGYRKEFLGEVRFVPLVETDPEPLPLKKEALQLLKRHLEPFDAIATANLDPFLERAGKAKVVLLGESTHGTHEFYALRARLTQKLIEKKGFNLIAVEADWPDAAYIHRYICQRERVKQEKKAFTRFPTWMWRNEEMHELSVWLKNYNALKKEGDKIGFYGLDLYSLHRSIHALIDYLEERDPKLAAEAKECYACLSRWKKDPSGYGLSHSFQEAESCEEGAVKMLFNLQQMKVKQGDLEQELFFDAQQNARLIVSAEKYYRTLYSSYHSSWNLREEHLFNTLESLFEFKGEDAKAIIWAHNSHVGDATITDRGEEGELSLGQLCRERWGEDAYLVGLFTGQGQVAAASSWGGSMEMKAVRPPRPDSYEHLMQSAAQPAYFLPIKGNGELSQALLAPRLERAIGVIYRPERELESHYYKASLSHQFDEVIWFSETKAIKPLGHKESHEFPSTYPFGA
ncbi:MAG: hypothetical protein K0S07_686 [Chlamydiales bacterium]|jgi:protein-L-isoaspartate(D-aspartate) O-methyltransferase|nr:hypothetical protein [Chlamydiales bacterium]